MQDGVPARGSQRRMRSRGEIGVGQPPRIGVEGKKEKNQRALKTIIFTQT